MKLFGFFVLALTLSLMACKGDMGDLGPAGPQGEQGIEGEQGPKGDKGDPGEDGADGANGADGADGADGQNGQDGEDGEDGNANVFSSPWVDVVWSTPSGTFGSFDITAPEITQEDLDKSVLLGYVKESGFYYNCPHSWNGGGAIGVINMAFSLGLATMYYQSESASFTPSDNLEARYVIIPSAGRLAADSDNPKQAILDELEEANVDINNYDEVIKYLEIR